MRVDHIDCRQYKIARYSGIIRALNSKLQTSNPSTSPPYYIPSVLVCVAALGEKLSSLQTSHPPRPPSQRKKRKEKRKKKNKNKNQAKMVFHWLHEARTDLSRELTLPLFTTVLYASLAGMSYGLDLNYWSGLLGMPQFQHDFGVFDSALQTWKIPASWQSVGSGTPTAGIACGALLAGYLGNRWGRIRAFWTAAGIGLVGILIQATSVRSYWQLVGGRIVNALSMGIICK